MTTSGGWTGKAPLGGAENPASSKPYPSHLRVRGQSRDQVCVELLRASYQVTRPARVGHLPNAPLHRGRYRQHVGPTAPTAALLLFFLSPCSQPWGRRELASPGLPTRCPMTATQPLSWTGTPPIQAAPSSWPVQSPVPCHLISQSRPPAPMPALVLPLGWSGPSRPCSVFLDARTCEVPVLPPCTLPPLGPPASWRSPHHLAPPTPTVPPALARQKPRAWNRHVQPGLPPAGTEGCTLKDNNIGPRRKEVGRGPGSCPPPQRPETSGAQATCGVGTGSCFPACPQAKSASSPCLSLPVSG